MYHYTAGMMFAAHAHGGRRGLGHQGWRNSKAAGIIASLQEWVPTRMAGTRPPVHGGKGCHSAGTPVTAKAWLSSCSVPCRGIRGQGYAVSRTPHMPGVRVHAVAREWADPCACLMPHTHRRTRWASTCSSWAPLAARARSCEWRAQHTIAGRAVQGLHFRAACPTKDWVVLLWMRAAGRQVGKAAELSCMRNRYGDP
jgi:hypothetical protein